MSIKKPKDDFIIFRTNNEMKTKVINATIAISGSDNISAFMEYVLEKYFEENSI